ncbi:MAG: sensor domain-containing protein [Polynucleobacter sp.]
MSQEKTVQDYSAKVKESTGEDLYESDDFLKNIVDSSSDAIITKDLKGVIRSWNKGAEKIFGYSAQEMIGESMLRLIPEDLLYEEEVFLKTIASGKSIDHFQARRIHKDGRIIHVSISLSPIRNSQGVIFGISKIARDVSKEFELMEALKLVKSAVENSTDAIITKDLNGIISGWNKGAENIFGYSAQEMIGASMLRLFPPNRELEEALILEKISSGKRVDTFQTERIHKDGHMIHLSVTISPIFDSRGVVMGATKIARDITVEWNLTNRLKVINEIYQQSHQAVVLTDEHGTITEVNPAFTIIMGYQPEEVIGKNPLMFHSSKQGPEVIRHIEDEVLEKNHFQGEVWARRKDGSTVASLLTIGKIQTTEGSRFAGIFSDITALKASEDQLLKIVHYDPLTGLPNRLLFIERLKAKILSCAQLNGGLAIIYIDLDDFSHINEQFSLAVGDRLMIEVARRLSASMREADSLARVGSDEFVGYLSGMANNVEFEVLMERLMRNLSAPFTIENQSVQITGSIGVRFFACDDAQNIELLVRQADQAMIAAKQSGKHRYIIFDPARDLETKQRLASLDDISNGIARNEFFMKYQPKVNLKSGEMTGVEALVRWNHSSKGVLTPGDFLPGLIDTKLKIEFTENVIKMAFAQSVAWAKEGLVPVVSINVYINQLQDTFFDFIKIQMAQFPNLNPRNIEFELLETDALLDTAKAIYIMEELHALGFSFSIDDFGTGYSSLTYLRKLPFDTIKIDQGFVLNEGLAEKNVDIVRAIIELAKIFDRHVIAEGIETVEIGTRLIELGCLHGQGYAIAKPMEAKEIIKWHEQWRAPEVWLTAIAPTLNPS